MAFTRMLPNVGCALVVVALAGCAGISGRLAPPAAPVATGEFRVGAAQVDITPMPGFSMGGYSVAGRISRGVWLRLHARAVCLEDAEGHGLAMVSADLWAMPAGLADRVAELVVREHGIRNLAREQFILAATHTHNGPGNFSSSYIYNELASLHGGFDRRLFEFLAHRIASAVAEAWTNREPATLRYTESVVFGVSRNRSLDAFWLNGAPAQALMDQNRDLPIRATSFRIGGEDAYRAVDPALKVICAETKHAPRELLAVMAFYPVHPTVMDTATEVYNSDIFGVATSQVERALAAKSSGARKPVVALFNGAEGDVAANWRRRDRSEAIALGSLLAQGIHAALTGIGEPVGGPISGSFGYSRLSELATPISGASTLCGAEADWSFYRDAGFHEGMTQPEPAKQIAGQGVKRHPAEDDVKSKAVRDLIQCGIAHVLKPPRRVPLGVYRIGPLVVGTLPGEFTTMLGRRIATALRQETPAAEHVILVGLANEYLSYFATEAEYAAQTYEASSMIYGPKAGTRICDDLVALARNLDKTIARAESRRYHYDAGPVARFGVGEFDLLSHMDRLCVTHNSIAPVLMDAEHGVPVPDYPRFVWIDRNPSWPARGTAAQIVMPFVRMEIKSATGWSPLTLGAAVEDDSGLNFVTTEVASLLGKTRWITIWMTPASLAEDSRFGSAEFRFAVRSNGGEFYSPAFTLDSARARWGFTGLAREPAGTNAASDDR